MVTFHPPSSFLFFGALLSLFSLSSASQLNHADVINPRFTISDAVNSFFILFLSIPLAAPQLPTFFLFKIMHM
ncbi:hypothetical protein Ahy_B01g055183 isoform A [Arachis hypogaea]|uniref:Uncharacterized protein n=1 Tax=Arachis hypogaea TaxID=3818 RepID=A0A445AVF5_ARAHY|nr:hypothetical protein Ahy_B01g055183 isoform A [Arachis hypogaea]